MISQNEGREPLQGAHQVLKDHLKQSSVLAKVSTGAFEKIAPAGKTSRKYFPDCTGTIYEHVSADVEKTVDLFRFLLSPLTLIKTFTNM
jgi:hypothetical protein